MPGTEAVLGTRALEMVLLSLFPKERPGMVTERVQEDRTSQTRDGRGLAPVL